MKKILLAAVAGLCVIGATVGSTENKTVRSAFHRDTLPGDTTKKPSPDTSAPKLVYLDNMSFRDTVPPDSPKKFNLAYVRLNRDTTPTDTSKKLNMAYLHPGVSINDTTPKKDTSKLDLAIRYSHMNPVTNDTTPKKDTSKFDLSGAVAFVK